MLYETGPARVVGDVDGDGHVDYVLEDGVVRSGPDGSVIRAHSGGILRCVSGGADFTGDAIDDYAMHWKTAASAAEVVLYSGADASVVLTLSFVGSGIEGSVDLVADLDGDGRGELLVGISGEVISSIDHSVLYSFPSIGPSWSRPAT